jgi:two-component system NtrC family response regulator
MEGTEMAKLIIVEDDQGLREQMKWALGEEFQVLEADTLESTLTNLQAENPPLVCLDLGLEGRSDRGLEVIDAVLTADRGCKIVVVTGNGDGSLGKEAIRRGAFDFLPKPLDIEGLRGVLERALRIHELEDEVEESEPWSPSRSPALANETSATPGQDSRTPGHASWTPGNASWTPGSPIDSETPMLGESEPMRAIFSILRRLASTDVSVLITGESGTGKELCARAIHNQSRRSNAPFVPINCGAIPENLLESELFGYVRGAFSGADADKPGLIEAAHRGTLFLDEIGDMPQPLQVKLLRFLQDQRLQRLGETRGRALDVRIIAATNKSNISGSDGSALRSDLYYRLSEFEVALPPLRDRGRDVILLSHAILERNRQRFGQPRLRLSSRAEKAILAYGWPGNVRELENRLNRASITCRGQVIEDEDLQLHEGVDGNLSYREARKMFEKNLLQNALRRSGGNVSLAARTVGVTRPTFYDMMKKTGIFVRQEVKT